MLKDEYDKITHEIIGSAMEVHKILGNEFQEVVYQRALSVEMNLRQIEHKRELEMRLCYKGFDVGERLVDFLVANEISVLARIVCNLKDYSIRNIKFNLENLNKIKVQTSMANGHFGINFK
jgi:GxxExxY protein